METDDSLGHGEQAVGTGTKFAQRRRAFRHIAQTEVGQVVHDGNPRKRARGGFASSRSTEGRTPSLLLGTVP